MVSKGSYAESQVQAMCELYRLNQLAAISKKETPMVFGKGAPRRGKTTGFDFEGTGPDGRSVCVEVKETAKPSLAILQPGHKGSGLQWEQVQELKFRQALGAEAMIMWLHWVDAIGGDWHIIDPSEITAGQKSIRIDHDLFRECPIYQGLPDFLGLCGTISKRR